MEHAAFQVQDPVAVASWYVRHLGMTVKRAQAERPFGHFLADAGDKIMLEFYNHPKVVVPDYRAIDPLVLHIAFTAPDVGAMRRLLLAAGATAVGDVATNDAGDELAMMRDPWGLAVQLVSRRSPMIP